MEFSNDQVEELYQQAKWTILESDTGHKLAPAKIDKLARTIIRKDVTESEWQNWWQDRWTPDSGPIRQDFTDLDHLDADQLRIVRRQREKALHRQFKNRPPGPTPPVTEERAAEILAELGCDIPLTGD